MERASEIYHSAFAELSAVQLHLLDAEWRVTEYGELPNDCISGDGYEFSMWRATPLTEGWRITPSPAAAASDMAEWLKTNGWSDIQHRTYANGIADLTVTATKPDSFVKKILIDFKPGKVMDGIKIELTTICEPGRSSGVRLLLYPDRPLGTPFGYPETAHPTDPPLWGNTPIRTAQPPTP